MRILLHIVWNWENIKLRPAFCTSAVYHVKSNKPALCRSNVEGFNQPVNCARYHIQSPPQRKHLVSPLDVKDSYTRARNSKIIILFAGALYKNLMEIWNDKI
jgi:hypothetical protein